MSNSAARVAAPVRPHTAVACKRREPGWPDACLSLIVTVATHHPDDVRATGFYRDVIDALTASGVAFGSTSAMSCMAAAASTSSAK